MTPARVLLRLLRLAGREDVLADLEEEGEERLAQGSAGTATALWSVYQVITVVWYRLTERFSPVGLMETLHPLLALRLALRSFRLELRTGITSAMTLAVGFGAAGAIYSVLTGFGRPLPVPDGERVVQVHISTPGANTAVSSGDLYETWADRSVTLQRVGAFATRMSVVRAAGSTPRRVPSAAATTSVFRVLAVEPLMGRFPAGVSDAELTGQVVLGYDLWQELFSARAEVIGSEIVLDGRTRIVVGVMPEGYRFPYKQDLWIPVGDHEVGQGFEVVGRLTDDVDVASAQTELGEIAIRHVAGLGAEVPELRVAVRGFTEDRGESGEDVALFALLVIVLALLAVSATNVSNLLLVRGISRARTMAVHAALGAVPRQILLQMLAESLVVAVSGAALGLAVTTGIVRVVERTLSGHWGYYWMEVAIDPGVVVFMLAIALATAVVAGTAPAIQAMRRDVVAPLRSGAEVSGKQRRIFSRVLLTGQVAFSILALTVSGMMAIGMFRTNSVADGFPANSVHVAMLTLDGDHYREAEQRRDFRQAYVQDLAARPGVAAATISAGLPGLNSPIAAVSIDGVRDDPGEKPRMVATYPVAGDFFGVFGIEVEAGRTLIPGDQTARAAVAVVNRSFADRYFAGEDPIGHRVGLETPEGGDEDFVIVGVVADLVIYEGIEGMRRDAVYVPFETVESATFHAMVRATGGHGGTPLAESLRAIDPELPLTALFGNGGINTVADVLAFVRIIFQVVGTLSLLGGISAMLVAAFGLYGVVSFEVRRRVREIGIRMALGAPRGEVLAGVLRDGLWKVLPGLAIGAGLTYLVAPLFGVFLSGTNPRTPAAFVYPIGGFLAVSLLAAFIPARRAASVNPVEVLKAE